MMRNILVFSILSLTCSSSFAGILDEGYSMETSRKYAAQLPFRPAVAYIDPKEGSGNEGAPTAVLISPNVLLSAAHCTRGPGQTVRFIDPNGKSQYQTSIKQVINHPEFEVQRKKWIDSRLEERRKEQEMLTMVIQMAETLMVRGEELPADLKKLYDSRDEHLKIHEKYTAMQQADEDGRITPAIIPYDFQLIQLNDTVPSEIAKPVKMSTCPTLYHTTTILTFGHVAQAQKDKDAILVYRIGSQKDQYPSHAYDFLVDKTRFGYYQTTFDPKKFGYKGVSLGGDSGSPVFIDNALMGVVSAGTTPDGYSIGGYGSTGAVAPLNGRIETWIKDTIARMNYS